MKASAVFLILFCACLLAAQEHTNFGYAVMAPQPASKATENSSSATSSASTACTTGSVTVTAPQNGQQVSSPVLFKASATPDSGLTIVRMQLSIDGVSVYTVNGAVVNTSLSVSGGAHNLIVTATESNGATLSSATIHFTVSTGVTATFQGCVYSSNGNRYQAAGIRLSQPATVTFDANLYYGPSCNPNQWADRFGFGQSLNFGTFTYYFWFSDFANQLNMSAIWKINNQSSACINYATAPPC